MSRSRRVSLTSSRTLAWTSRTLETSFTLEVDGFTRTRPPSHIRNGYSPRPTPSVWSGPGTPVGPRIRSSSYTRTSTHHFHRTQSFTGITVGRWWKERATLSGSKKFFLYVSFGHIKNLFLLINKSSLKCLLCRGTVNKKISFYTHKTRSTHIPIICRIEDLTPCDSGFEWKEPLISCISVNNWGGRRVFFSVYLYSLSP